MAIAYIHLYALHVAGSAERRPVLENERAAIRTQAIVERNVDVRRGVD
jgi:hypothetical protein